ncbi:MAG: antibiotic ABC transporter ATP-binding protein [Thermobacillus sp. ZCTH02-B1]|uniref:ABC transporter ATP-binding protein n=1 Tax=Thermobacillus sp. ZCTH02-B1 TaxID=1858795 RepID=UPI000B56AE47|nr:ABC transporter ATP-binding protein [Thermobacillus sp. ZCTH02-B1]OUM94680.1 MAG: antibiotic ABC transporter ATP-binding protein [Thermobacillus sp. ZCTH02-B1]
MSHVRLRQVVKRYGTKVSVDHLTLSIEKGEIFGLLGPNGAGKSTTIKMICGLIRSDQGEVEVDGESVRHRPLSVKAKIGLVPQEIALYEQLTAEEHLRFFGKLYGLRGRRLEERIDEALAFTGLTGHRNERPGSFSGGMKRRLNIACAIVHQPKLIIMDEPTVGIDPQSRNHILESVRELNRRGATILYTSHYMEEVEAISTRVGIIDHGRLIALGTIRELLTQVEEQEKLVIETEGLTDAAVEEVGRHASVRRVERRDGVLEIWLRHAQSYLQDMLYILAKHGVRIASLRSETPNLETLFLTLTGRHLRD